MSEIDCRDRSFVFVGAGLLLMKNNLLAILFLIIPGLWLYNFVSEAWHGHQEAKKRVAARAVAIGPTGNL